MNFTRAQLLGCIQREINSRRKLFPRLVSGSKMNKKDAETEIAMMEEIYRRLSFCKCTENGGLNLPA